MAWSHGAISPCEVVTPWCRCGIGKWRMLPWNWHLSLWCEQGWRRRWWRDRGCCPSLAGLSGTGAACPAACVCGAYKGALISVGASGPCHNAEIMSLLLSAHSTSSLRWLASSSRQNLPRLKWMCHHLPQQIRSPLMMGQAPLARRATAVIQAPFFLFPFPPPLFPLFPVLGESLAGPRAGACWWAWVDRAPASPGEGRAGGPAPAASPHPPGMGSHRERSSPSRGLSRSAMGLDCPPGRAAGAQHGPWCSGGSSGGKGVPGRGRACGLCSLPAASPSSRTPARLLRPGCPACCQPSSPAAAFLAARPAPSARASLSPQHSSGARG